MNPATGDRWERARGVALIVYAACLPLSITGAQIALAVLLVVVIADWRRGRPPRMDGMAWPLVAYLAWTALTCMTSVDVPRSLSKLPGFWIHLAWFALVPAMADRRWVNRALVALSISAALMGLYAAAQWRWGDAVPRFLAGHPTLWQKHGGHNLAVGLFDHHLTFGNAMVLASGMILAAAGLDRRRRRFHIAAGLSASLGILFSYARGAWIAAAILAAMWAYGMGRRVFIRAAVAGVVALSLVLAASPTLRDRVDSVFRAGANVERVQIWRTSLAMAVDHPWTGIGPGAYRVVVDDYRKNYNVKWTTKAHAHNSYFMAAAESGWPGGALMVLLIGSSLFLARSWLLLAGPGSAMRWPAAAVAGILVGFSVSTFFQHNMGDAEVALGFWFVCAFAVNARDWTVREGT